MTGTLNNRLIGYRSHIYHTTQSLSEPTWLDTAWPYRTNVLCVLCNVVFELLVQKSLAAAPHCLVWRWN